MIVFAYPLVFLLILLPLIFRKLFPAAKGLHGDALRVPDVFANAIENINTQINSKFSLKTNSTSSGKAKTILLYIIWTFLVCAAARPQIVGEPIPVRNFNREILLVLDISNSMLEQDFIINNKRIDRLNAVKKTVSEFIKNRANDKIGIIFFASNAYLQVPITFDKKSAEETLWEVEAGMAGNSTAIGDALGLALKTLRKAGDLDKKVIILLTDGENNDGSLSLAEVIDLAKKEGIKIYTIGVGSEDSLVNSMLGFNIKMGASGLDEKSLREIAEATKGNYFKANDTKGLEEIYRTIDKLEPNLNEDIYIQEVKDIYYIPLILAIFLASILILLARKVKS